MKKVLLLPLLNSMPSGHHQVADAVCESIYENSEEIECKKLDILSEWNHRIEQEIVKFYLGWIRRFPKSYAWIYRQFAYRSKSERPQRVYQILFMKKVKDILRREKPDLIICTHGFPSLFINRLKESGECNVPAVNIYTDFFINDVWGRSHIDYHLVPSVKIKKELSAKYHVDSNRIFVTGIPISGKFLERNRCENGEPAEPFQILLSGGSVGLGNLAEMLKEEAGELDCRVKVLCGANKKLYEEINRIPGDFAEAYPYIASKEEMNRIYENSDAIISKPGGVTISEAIRKDLPIFISSALPGQEQINLQLLNGMGLVFIIPEGVNALDFVCRQLKDRDGLRKFKEAADRYRNSVELADSRSMFGVIEQLLERS